MHERRSERSEEFLAEVARAYYERGLTQEQVAGQFGVSRSQVSRYLSEARDLQIVQTRVVPSEARDREAETELQEHFGHLRRVVVTAAFATNPLTIRRTIARGAARLIERLVRPGSTLCFGAGRTLAETVSLLGRRPLGNVTVVQAMGNAGHEGLHIDYNAIARGAAEAFDGRAIQINAPAILGKGARASELEASNRQISEALGLARSADLYVVGIGSVTGDQMYVNTGLIALEELDRLAEVGAVGDICGNFFDIDGRPVQGAFRDRLVGISLADLRRAPLALACAGGEEKVPAVLGALRGRLISALVTDEHTARGVLRLMAERSRHGRGLRAKARPAIAGGGRP